MFKIYYGKKIIYLLENQKDIDEGYVYDSDFSEKIKNFLHKSTSNNLKVLCKNPQKILNKLIEMFDYIEAAGGYVINKKNESLVIYRYGKWDLPKGKIEKDEAIKQAAIREVEEECGIHNLKIISELPSTFHIFSSKKNYKIKRTYWFKMKYSGDEKLVPQKEENILDAKWVPDDTLEFVMINTFDNLLDLFYLKRNELEKLKK